MNSKRQNAYVLRTVAYGDRDVIVTLFCAEVGRVSAIARSARASKKRFAGGIEPFSLLDVQYKQRPGRDLAVLEETIIQNGHPKIREDFDKITVASYATELIGAFVQESQGDAQLFHVLHRFFVTLEELEVSVIPVSLLRFELDVLRVTGFAPILDACAQCGNSAFEKIRMARDGSGRICSDCGPKMPTGIVEQAAFDILLWCSKENTDDPPDALLNPTAIYQARKVIRASMERIIDYNLKTLPLLETFLDDVVATREAG